MQQNREIILDFYGKLDTMNEKSQKLTHFPKVKMKRKEGCFLDNNEPSRLWLKKKINKIPPYFIKLAKLSKNYSLMNDDDNVLT